MSKSLNVVTLSGYLGADPKVHTFDDGSKVANLRLAVGKSKKQNGEWVDDTLWIDVAARGNQAEAIEQYLGKGSFIMVTGELGQLREWEKDGETRHSMQVDYARVTFGPRAENGNGGGNGGGGNDDDDIPF
jgi:single-strand DNA-binding protein